MNQLFHVSRRVCFTPTLMRRPLGFCQRAAHLQDNFMLTSLGGGNRWKGALSGRPPFLPGRLNEEDGTHS